MKNKEIKRRLENEIEMLVPDVLGNILEEVSDLKVKEVKKMKKDKVDNVNKERKIYIPKLAFVMVCMIFVVGGLVGFNFYQDSRVVSTIEFDVNPSIELKLDKDREVLDVLALNKDGEKILKNMDLEHVGLEVAVNAIIGSMLKNGYLDEIKNSILVSVKNDDKNEASRLQEELSDSISKILKANSIEGAILTQEYSSDKKLEDKARDNELSEGKVSLINKILEKELKDYKGDLYTFDDLSKLSINDLNLLLNSKNVLIDSVSSNGEVSEKGYISKDKVKEIVLEHAKLSKNDVKYIEIELDSERGKLVYEVEFDTKSYEYEYEIDAKSGEVVRDKKERNDDLFDD